jgi:hypothetical protein
MQPTCTTNHLGLNGVLGVVLSRFLIAGKVTETKSIFPDLVQEALKEDVPDEPAPPTSDRQI